jgi:hypothetical protein
VEQRFWVIGGHYADCRFKTLESGTEVLHGPYADERKARMEWQRLTFKDRSLATERYSICVEPVLQ